MTRSPILAPRSLPRVILVCLAAALVWGGCSSCRDRSRPPQSSPSAPGEAAEPAVREFPQKRAPAEPDPVPPGERRVRPAAVAGSWYPGDKDELARTLDGLLDSAPRTELPGPVMALVSPHAGYTYSGKPAAAGYATLRGRTIKRVVVLGVSHRVPFAGASIAEVTHYQTPLGLIPLDRAAVAHLRRSPVVGSVAEAHRREHSLEIQLPLLQRVLPGFRLVPLLLGQMDEAAYTRLAAALRQILDPQTLVVASSDFTHRGPNYSYEVPEGPGSVEQRLTRLDRGAIERILALDPKGLLTYKARTGSTICGIAPVATLLHLLKGVEEAKATLVSYTTSAAVSGDWSNSVSYVDIAFSGRWPEGEAAALERARSAGAAHFPLSAADRATLLRLARDTLNASVKAGQYDAGPLEALTLTPSLRRKAGAFVTLKCALGPGAVCQKKGGDGLRGCIGTIAPIAPVAETVARRAASAALEDPRFPSKVSPEELSRITVEVSVLTPPRTVAGPEAIQIGRHGIILSKGGRSATYLPQVAPEQGWDRPTTLSHLARKAGLGPEGWRSGATFQVYEAIVFAEGE